MPGPDILTASLTHRGVTTGQQYNSRSDWHSKVACWGALFDVLSKAHMLSGAHGAHPLWHDATAGRLGFRVNHRVSTNVLDKNLDIIVCEIDAGTPQSGITMRSVAKRVGLQLTDPTDLAFLAVLDTLPLQEIDPSHIGNVRLAIEAKAVMNDIGKATPRLYAEILAAGVIVRDAQLNRGHPRTVYASLNLVNAAVTFLSSTTHKIKSNAPGEAQAAVNMMDRAFRYGIINQAVPNGVNVGPTGPRTQVFDAVGITVIDCVNDPAVPVTLHVAARGHPNPVTVPTASQYTTFVADICNKY